MELYIKYMVGLRCKNIAKSKMDSLGLNYKISAHGAVEFAEEITEDQYGQFKKNLMKSGMVLLCKSKSMLIDNIINTIVEVIYYTDTLPRIKSERFLHKML